MYPILARFGPFFLYSYTVVMAAAVLSGIGLATLLGRKEQRSSESWLSAVLAATLIGLIVGRIVFVLTNFDYYLENISQIPFIWSGGLNYHGVLIAGLITLGLWARFKGLNFGQTAVLFAPSLALVSLFGWFACWLDGCAYGRETVHGLLAADLPDSFGVFALRYSTQIVAAVLCLLIFGLVLFLHQTTKIRWLPWLTLLLLSASRLVVTLLRGDPVPLIGGIRADTIAEGLLVAASLLAILIVILRKPRIVALEGPRE